MYYGPPTPDTAATPISNTVATPTPLTTATPTTNTATIPISVLITPTTDQSTTPSRVSSTVEDRLPTTEPPTEYQCGGPVTADVGTLHSQNWPETYPTNVNCDWIVSLPNPNLVLEIAFEEETFGIAGRMPKCKKDWVKVHQLGVNRTVTQTWGPFCDFGTPPTILTNTSTAMVQFHSGAKHGSSRKGFKLYYQALEICVPPPPPLVVQGE